jgi:glycosyltransferase involved in cell wall biosynthesis
MKILYLCPDYGIPVLGRKGASVHVRQMIAAFGRAGHSVVLAAPSASKSPWEEPATLVGRFLHLPASDHIQAVFYALKEYTEMLGVAHRLPGELRRILYDQEMEAHLKHRFSSEPPDMIYVRGSLYSSAGVGLAQNFNRPLLVELNAPLAAEQTTYRSGGLGELSAHAERWMLSRADAVLAVSAALRDHVVSLGIDASRVHLFPNGIDPTLFFPAPPDPAVRQRFGLGEGPLLGFVGGLRPWHGVRALPVLLARLSEEHRDARLVIVGDGPLRDELEQSLVSLGLMRQVIFTGALPHEDIAPLIRQFDVALAPYAPFDHDFYFSPLKLFEYMACGVPVVAASLGQIPEVIRDNETGLLYPPGDLDQLTAACHRLLADPALRLEIGILAAQEVHQNYTWDHNARRAVELARSLQKAL